MNRVLTIFILVIISANLSFAQQKMDSLSRNRDTVLVPASLPAVAEAKANAADTMPFVTPKKTALFSAVVPGLGQFHNKQYWKIPVIYGLIGVSVYFLNDNIKNYNAFRREAAGRESLDPNFKRNPEFAAYSDPAVKEAQDYYRRNLDLTALLTAVGYTLQVIDAVVFAHLKGFDISDDISLNLRPVLMPQGGAGLGLVMKF